MRFIHPIAGTIALLCICAFWLSTIAAEAFGTRAMVVTVKTGIPWGFIILIPALALTGISGVRLTKNKGSRLSRRKLRRMPIIALNGLLILIPSALYLASAARAGSFDNAFIAVQSIELIAGAINIMLLGLNFRDGFRLGGRFSVMPRKAQS